MDQISNLLTSIRNAEMAGLRTTAVVNTKMNAAILRILQEGSFIESFQVPETADGKSKITVTLVPSALHTFKRISKPGRRIYSPVDSIPRVLQGRGIAILSTPKGVLTDREARKARVGGELLCTVF